MEDGYNMADLRGFISGGRTYFPSISGSKEFMVNPHHPYANVLTFRPDPTAIMAQNAAGAGLEMDGGAIAGADSGTGRWPRQETLTLLEIRTRLDYKFKEVNHQKAPLWDEISRIMSEEYGYHRSGKKCREKFENLYKYYKKTKEGKGKRQDGKHYRFFRQLEALYGGETSKSVSEVEAHFHGGNYRYSYSNDDVSMGGMNNNNSNNQEPPKFSDTCLVSASNCSDSVEISSGESDVREMSEDEKGKKKLGKRNLKGKIMSFIDEQMNKLMEKQEVWMAKVMKTIEDKEHERILREEKWRKQDALRIEREHSFWASEKAWIESRDNALMEAFHKAATVSGDQFPGQWVDPMSGKHWTAAAATTTTTMNNHPTCGIPQEALWEEVARKMGNLGGRNNGLSLREQWDSLNDFTIKGTKKRKENENLEAVYCDTTDSGGGIEIPMRLNHHNNHWGAQL